MKKSKKLCAILLASSLMFSQSIVADAAFPNPVNAARSTLDFHLDMRRLCKKFNDYDAFFEDIVSKFRSLILSTLESDYLLDDERQTLMSFLLRFVERETELETLRQNVYKKFPELQGTDRMTMHISIIKAINTERQEIDNLSSHLKEVILQIKNRRNGMSNNQSEGGFSSHVLTRLAEDQFISQIVENGDLRQLTLSLDENKPQEKEWLLWFSNKNRK